MPKKHNLFLFRVSQRSERGGGVELVGTKYQVFPKIRLEGFPYLFEKLKGYRLSWKTENFLGVGD